jgi:hypothetical protein
MTACGQHEEAAALQIVGHGNLVTELVWNYAELALLLAKPLGITTHVTLEADFHLARLK